MCGAVIFDRPFLAPLHTWSASGGGGSFRRLPAFVRFILQYLLNRIKSRRTVHCAQGRPKSGQALEKFRTDAKAEGEQVAIGGWRVAGAPSTREASWFAVKLNRRNAPWAFTRGEAFRTIASLELLGVLVSVMVLMPAEEFQMESLGSVSMTCGTDNQGNSHLVSRCLTTRWPLSAILECSWGLCRRSWGVGSSGGGLGPSEGGLGPSGGGLGPFLGFCGRS